MYSAVVVADDLTGAMDTAHGFAVRGHDASVVAIPSSDGAAGAERAEATVLGVNTDSRYADEGDAAAAVRGVVESVPADAVYKKVDSTLRGNLAAEVDAALAASGAAVALVAPAFPAAARTTEGGVHRVEGTPVAGTEYGDDEKGPASSSLPESFAGLDRPVVTVPLEAVEAGPERVAAELETAVERSERAPIVVPDATEEGHLATVAAAGGAVEGGTLYVGSGGLAAHVDVPVPSVDADEPAAGTRGDRSARQSTTGAPLGVVGSVNATTLAQLEAVPDEAVVELDPTELLAEEGTGPDGTASEAVETLRAGRPAVLTAATDRAAVDRTVAAGRDRGLPTEEVRERVADGLADVAALAVREGEPSGLVLTGGDVAVAVLRSLGATTVELTGEDVGAGVPVGRLVDGIGAGTPVVTKAGGFGARETIVNSLEAVGRFDE
ncbi:four-carbon acid sugar kinase family protein [Halorarum salinum]|uniref:Four-carbon acid sugar kinase family protein n=1 Tax=Halorarum salinum TaxID=2743089 RepID=A0A7D5QAG5_9EURY|nr:four-carbon acid sugar kinase family protein [Halobaculum salinum]QLG60960.1 four-carbon acid sugar kinase family protein [Halobaculum salinum]